MTDKNTNGLNRRVDKARSGLLFELSQGRYAANDRLPSERDLAGVVGVSRTTLRKAIAQLIEQGHIEQRHGFGTFAVRNPSVGRQGKDHDADSKPLVSDGPGQDMLKRGEATRSEDLTSGFYLPSADEVMMLDVDPQAQVLRITRVWLADDGRPVAHEEVATPRQTHNLPSRVAAMRRLQRVRSGTVTEAAASTLGLAKNTTGLLIEERSVDARGLCTAFTRLTRSIADLDLTYVMSGPIDRPRSG